jgi:hypothetical protein
MQTAYAARLSHLSTLVFKTIQVNRELTQKKNMNLSIGFTRPGPTSTTGHPVRDIRGIQQTPSPLTVHAAVTKTLFILFGLSFQLDR